MPHVQPFQLPAELIHRIIDHLGESKPAFKTCALVSRVFLPYAREKLFSCKLELSRHRVESFLKLCDDSSSTFPAALAKIKEFTFRSCMHEMSMSPIAREDSVAFNQLLTWRGIGRDGKEETMVDMLVNVKMLSIGRVEWWILEDRARYALLVGFQNVVKITLWALRFEKVEEFSSFISSFPRLEDVCLQSLRLNPNWPADYSLSKYSESVSDHELGSEAGKLPLVACARPCLRSITEHDVLPAEFIDALVPYSHSVCNVQLSLDLTESSRMASMNRLLVSAGPALEGVSLLIYHHNGLPEGDDESALAIASLFAQIDFASNTRIREIHFPSLRQQYVLPFLKCVADARSSYTSNSFSAPAPVPRASPPSLEILEITDLANLSLDWDELDRLLASHWYFSELREVRCTIRTGFFKEDVMRQLQREARYVRPDEGSAAEAQMVKNVQEFVGRMPRSAGKGILRVKEIYTYIDLSWINAVVARFAQAHTINTQAPQVVRRSARNRLTNMFRKVVRAVRRIRGRRSTLSFH